ncbi:MAG: hypothetical protein ACOCWB_03375 [Bacteroidota bacterium]
MRKVNKLISRAYNKSDFYKKQYKQFSEKDLYIHTIEDLQKLPIVSKDDMKQFNASEIIMRKNIDNLIVRSTSGSTGKPFDTYLTKKEYFTSYFRTFFSLHKYNPFSYFCLIGVYKQKEEIEQKSFLFYLQKYFGLFRRKAYSVFTPIHEIVADFRKTKISILSATPTCLEVLIEELKKHNEKLNVGYVVLFGETLMDDVKADIKTYLQAKIINVYGCMEHPSLAWTKPDKEYFDYAPNSIILEYINPVTINGDLYGELVITNLVNKTMPFIRYKIGDHVKIHNDYRKMGKIIGRIEDVITLKNGTQLFRLQVWSVFRNLHECQQYRLLQKKDKSVHFQCVCKKNENEQDVKKKVLDIWNDNFPDVPLNVDFFEELSINPKTGKFKNIEVEK